MPRHFQEEEKYSDDSSNGEGFYAEDAKVGMKQQLTPDGKVVKECLIEGTDLQRPAEGYQLDVTIDGECKQWHMGEPDSGLAEGILVAIGTMRKGEKSLIHCTSSEYTPSPPTTYEVQLNDWVVKTDISTAHDKSLLKELIQKGDGWDGPEYESECTISIGDEKKEITIGSEQVSADIETCLLSMKKNELCQISTMPGVTIQLHEFNVPLSRFSIKPAEKIAEAQKRKDQGNSLYKDGLHKQALKKYQRAVEYLDDEYEVPEEDKAAFKEIRIPALTNQALIELHLGMHTECLATCGKALENDSKNLKALLRKAKAEIELDRWTEARRTLEKLLDLDPGNKSALSELQRLKKLNKAQDAKDLKGFGGMFSKMQTADTPQDDQQATLTEEPK
eukprot:TRINITY_DN8528_c1_g1_i1.p1 TRINITY_DN8528_c1_g1~~TRINITY_DN8528_c1_g1_i1.p1  ORF type:complete len:391 (+),score=98.64 TRINITY_DN8528_c1_g1_i1:1686-2858(+)